jgi:hypothetical protein
MKATIEFPEWIDENEWEYMGYKEIERGEYCIESLRDDECHFRSWNQDPGFGYYFCFRKKQKLEWPEWVKDGTRLEHFSNGWRLGHKTSVRVLYVDDIPDFLHIGIDTSTLDKNKVYIKGE